jgi:hypothetical protein
MARMTAMGRQLPTVDVGYPDAQLGGRLSGGEIAHPAVAGRPSVVGRVDGLDVGSAALGAGGECLLSGSTVA